MSGTHGPAVGLADALTSEQRAAATAPDGPALVLAGPGTGKTRTLTARFVHLVRGRPPAERVAASDILAVTFTRAAAAEMRERIAAALGLTPALADELSIGTLHGFAHTVLKAYPEEAGLPAEFRVIAEPEQRRVLDALKLDWPSNEGDLVALIASFKDRSMSPREVLQRRIGDGRYSLRRAARAFALYERALARLGWLDFADLTNRAVRLLKQCPEVREEVAGAYRHLLFDEYHDVNAGQIALVRLLVAGHRNIWAVADDDQAIYGFRGADSSHAIAFEREFPGARIFALTANYRSAPAIVAAASALIGTNEERREKALQPTSEDRGDAGARKARPLAALPPVVAASFKSERREAAWIADSILEAAGVGREASHDPGTQAYPSPIDRRAVDDRAAAHGAVDHGAVDHGAVDFGDVAVLVRTGSLCFHLQAALMERQLPFVLRGVSDFWEANEVRAYMTCAEALATEEANASSVALGRRLSVALADGEHWREAIKREARAMRPAGLSQARLRAWLERIEEMDRLAQDCESLEVLVEACEAYRQERIDLERGTAGPAVTLSTLHGAKGLEWPLVFLAGFEKGSLPHARTSDIEEERRLAYVGMTRARAQLVLSWSQRRHGGFAGPSPFLPELRAGLSQREFAYLRDGAVDLGAPRHVRPMVAIASGGAGEARTTANMEGSGSRVEAEEARSTRDLASARTQL